MSVRTVALNDPPVCLDQSLLLSWTVDPSSNYGNITSGFAVVVSDVSEPINIPLSQSNLSSKSVQLNGLTNGIYYTVQLTLYNGVNSLEDTISSNAVTAQPCAVPAAPAILLSSPDFSFNYGTKRLLSLPVQVNASNGASIDKVDIYVYDCSGRALAKYDFSNNNVPYVSGKVYNFFTGDGSGNGSPITLNNPLYRLWATAENECGTSQASAAVNLDTTNFPLVTNVTQVISGQEKLIVNMSTLYAPKDISYVTVFISSNSDMTNASVGTTVYATRNSSGVASISLSDVSFNVPQLGNVYFVGAKITNASGNQALTYGTIGSGIAAQTYAAKYTLSGAFNNNSSTTGSLFVTLNDISSNTFTPWSYVAKFFDNTKKLLGTVGPTTYSTILELKNIGLQLGVEYSAEVQASHTLNANQAQYWKTPALENATITRDLTGATYAFTTTPSAPIINNSNFYIAYSSQQNANNLALQLFWEPPSSTGFSPITSYDISLCRTNFNGSITTIGNQSVSMPADTNVVFGNLNDLSANLVGFFARITARNANGASPAVETPMMYPSQSIDPVSGLYVWQNLFDEVGLSWSWPNASDPSINTLYNLYSIEGFRVYNLSGDALPSAANLVKFVAAKASNSSSSASYTLALPASPGQKLIFGLQAVGRRKSDNSISVSGIITSGQITMQNVPAIGPVSISPNASGNSDVKFTVDSYQSASITGMFIPSVDASASNLPLIYTSGSGLVASQTAVSTVTQYSVSLPYFLSDPPVYVIVASNPVGSTYKENGMSV